MGGILETRAKEERTPAMEAPDGTPYKVELADILRGVGHQI
jgi:hypothetical protein